MEPCYLAVKQACLRRPSGRDKGVERCVREALFRFLGGIVYIFIANSMQSRKFCLILQRPRGGHAGYRKPDERLSAIMKSQ